jgi:hypothetical protein
MVREAGELSTAAVGFGFGRLVGDFRLECVLGWTTLRATAKDARGRGRPATRRHFPLAWQTRHTIHNVLRGGCDGPWGHPWRPRRG